MIQVDDSTKILLINAPEDYTEAIQKNAKLIDTHIKDETAYDFIHIFYVRRYEMLQDFADYKECLAKNGKLWASWPKARQLNTDLSLDAVIKIGYSNGLVESNNIRIDDVWTALKFTRPKPGKIYNNSHAKLVR